MVGKCRPQMLAIVVVTRHQVARHVQARQFRVQHGIFIRATEVHQVATDHHDVGTRHLGVQMIHRTTQCSEGIDNAVSQFLSGFKVQIADLRDEKRMIQNKPSANTKITMTG